MEFIPERTEKMKRDHKAQFKESEKRDYKDGAENLLHLCENFHRSGLLDLYYIKCLYSDQISRKLKRLRSKTYDE